MHNALFDGPLTHAAGRIFIIHHRQQKVNRQTAQKIMLRISRNCATFWKKVLDFLRLRWYNVREVKGGTPKGFQKDFEKNRKNLLTNSARHDIIGTEVKGKRFLKRRKATVKKLPKNFKKPLDKPSEKCYNESTRKPNAPWKVNILLRYQTSESLKRSSKNLLTNRRKYDIIKSQKDKDSPKNQKGFEYGKDQQDSYHQGYAFRGH